MKVRRKGEGEMNRNRFLAGILSLLLIITSVFTGNVVTAGAETTYENFNPDKSNNLYMIELKNCNAACGRVSFGTTLEASQVNPQDANVSKNQFNGSAVSISFTPIEGEYVDRIQIGSTEYRPGNEGFQLPTNMSRSGETFIYTTQETDFDEYGYLYIEVGFTGGGNGVPSYGKEGRLAFNIENSDKGDVFFQIGTGTKYCVGGTNEIPEETIQSALSETTFKASDKITVWAKKHDGKVVGNFDIRIEGTSVFASDDTARTAARTAAEGESGYTFTVPTGYASTQLIEFQIEFRDETPSGGGSNDVTYTENTTISADTTMNDITVSGGTLTIGNCSVRVDHKLVVASGASVVGTSGSSKLIFGGNTFSSGIALYYQDEEISCGSEKNFSNNGDGPIEFNWNTTSSKWVTNQQPAEGGGGGEAPWYTVSYGNSANLTTKNGKVYAERVHIGDITYSSIASEYNASEDDKIYSMEDTIFHQKTSEEDKDPLTEYGIGGSEGDIFIRNDVSGVSIDFKFIPDFGYQLTNIYTNENETDSLLNDFTAAEAVSSFKFNVIQGQNVHFEVKFEKVDNKVTGNANITSTAKIASTNAAASGTLNMIVDNATASSNITIPSGSEALAAYDITLTNEVSKGGDRGSWNTKLENLGNNVATVTLPVGNTANYTYSVIREHEGETPVTLNATVKNGAISFDTNKFSTYTIVRKPVSSGGGSSNNSGSSGDINDDGKNDVSNVKPSTGNTNSTGVLQGDDGSWYFFKDGVVDENYDDVAHNENGWWVVRDGKVDFSYQGIASNENGDWYCEKGKVNFNANGVLQSTAEESSGWYFVKDGKVQKGKETVEHNANGWWFIDKEGKVDFNKDTVAQNVNGWWVIQKGKVDFNYQGVATNPYGDWFCEKGKVNFAAQGVLQSTAKESNGWYFVKGGKVQKGKETVEQNRNGWWYVGKDGKVDFNMNTVAQNVNGWWMIQKGKVNFDYKGVASNQYGTWYLEGGKVNFNYNGKYTDANGKQYTIKNGQVIN